MFEKDAEEWADKEFEKYKTLEWYARKNNFQKGAEFGYNKGFKEGLKQKVNITTISDCPIKDEWHYVKDGDLPDNQRKVEIFTKDKAVFIAVIDSEGEEWYTGRYFGNTISMNQVIAWKEIVLPKESE